jgi:PEP-CTERM motif
LDLVSKGGIDMNAKIFALALALASAAPAAATVYNVNDVAGLTTITGTITTDGTLGVLDASNILAWNLTITYGTETAVLTGPPSITILDNELSATASQLLFAFGDPGPGYVEISNGSYSIVWAATRLNGDSISTYGLAPPYPSSINGMPNTSGNFSFQGGSTLPIASVVPEPSTSALMLVGFGGLGLSARLRAGKGRRGMAVA